MYKVNAPHPSSARKASTIRALNWSIKEFPIMQKWLSQGENLEVSAHFVFFFWSAVDLSNKKKMFKVVFVGLQSGWTYSYHLRGFLYQKWTEKERADEVKRVLIILSYLTLTSSKFLLKALIVWPIWKLFIRPDISRSRLSWSRIPVKKNMRWIFAVLGQCI